MASWILVPCLVSLRNEFNKLAPGRDTASDGSIGDTAHQQESSDHNPDETGRTPYSDADHVNEVHAIDVDNTLRAAFTMEDIVQFLLGRCRSGAEKRLRYIIYNRRIWSASSDWVQKTYTGASPHTEHAHFSASYVTALEASTATWGLIEKFGGDMELNLPKRGDKGEAVTEFQYLLSELGYPTAQDGDYGPKMETSVNAYRKAFGQGAAPYISGWHAFHMRRALTQKYAGKPGAPGKDGKDGTLSGRLTVTGGQLDVQGE